MGCIGFIDIRYARRRGILCESSSAPAFAAGSRSERLISNFDSSLTPNLNNKNMSKPSAAFVGASWLALIVGSLGYLIGLYNADRKDMLLNEKGFYFVVLMFGLFSVVSLQKSVRDRLDNIPVSDIYYGICWGAVMMSILLLVVGLVNANILLSEKGYYAFSFMFALFGAVTVQKNTRDSA